MLLTYARKRLEQLTKELSSYQAEEQKRLEHSLKVQREEDTKLTELKLKQEAERMMAEFETSLKKKVGKLKSGSKGFVAVKKRSRDIKLTLVVSSLLDSFKVAPAVVKRYITNAIINSNTICIIVHSSIVGLQDCGSSRSTSLFK